MPWPLALLVAVLFPVAATTTGSQISNFKEQMVSVTKTAGSSALITCDIHEEESYIHWYRFQKGKTPQHILYYDILRSTTTVDSGLNAEKFHAYEGARKSYKLLLKNVEESDGGVYYCATWIGTVVQTCFFLF